MDEERLYTQMVKAKRNNYIVAAVSAVIILLLAAALLRYFIFRDENPRLTPQGIEAVFEDSEAVYIESDGLYYECMGGESFLRVLGTKDWVETKAFYGQTPPYTRIHIAELYDIYVYPDGRINAYDGYAGTLQKANYYFISDNIYNNLKAFIEDNGMLADFKF